jgi:tripartite-type tricarboxylate transporter receptor subunit TctC
MNLVLGALVGFFVAFFPMFCWGQAAYPHQSVRVVVQFPPGSAPDMTARVMAEQLGSKWGRPVLVENILGAAGNVGAAHVAKAVPDGHTLLLSGDAAMTTNVTLYSNLPYHPLKDFAPITLVATSTNILVVHPAVKAQDVQELVALARAQPGQLSYASAGSGTSTHLGAELLKQMAGINIIHVPYKGSPPAVQDLVGGRVTMMFMNVVTALPLVKDGKLRALGVSSAKRWAATPNLPTIAESGFNGFEAVAWFGLLAPAKTPEAVLRKIHDEATAVLGMPEVRSRLVNTGLEVIAGSRHEFARQIETEIESKGRVIKAAGARAD